MKAAEILRKLADVIDQHSTEGDRPTNSVPHAELEPVAADNTDNTETSVVITPLQAKLELLKKATGVESVYDGANSGCGCGCDPCECDSDELELIKSRAGVPTAAVIELSDDEPLDL